MSGVQKNYKDEIKLFARHPVDQFGNWFREVDNSFFRRLAKFMLELVFGGIIKDTGTGNPLEPRAFCLATCGQNGAASGRMVWLRDFSPENGFVFYSNYESKKAIDVQKNSSVAMTFFWLVPFKLRQVRVEGVIEKLSEAENNADWARRTMKDKINKTVSPQSRVVGDYAELLTAAKKVVDASGGKEPSRPPHWGGYRIRPSKVEFLHFGLDKSMYRYVYEQENSSWKNYYLAP